MCRVFSARNTCELPLSLFKAPNIPLRQSERTSRDKTLLEPMRYWHLSGMMKLLLCLLGGETKGKMKMYSRAVECIRKGRRTIILSESGFDDWATCPVRRKGEINLNTLINHTEDVCCFQYLANNLHMQKLHIFLTKKYRGELHMIINWNQSLKLDQSQQR